MATLEEVVLWSPDDIRAGIRDLLPKGWSFEEELQHIRLLRPGKGGLEVEWEKYHVDVRLLLLGAYGHLWMRQHRPHPDSLWVRRNNPTREVITRRVALASSSRNVPDPGDIDPGEVKAVYEEVRRKKLWS